MGSKDAPQKMQYLGAIKKAASLEVPRQNAEVAGIFHRFGRHRSKIGPNPNVLAYSKSLWIGANMHIRVYEKNMPWKKSSCFSKVTPVVQKNRRITVSAFVSTAINHFTFEKFPPSLPLLHPIILWLVVSFDLDLKLNYAFESNPCLLQAHQPPWIFHWFYKTPLHVVCVHR